MMLRVAAVGLVLLTACGHSSGAPSPDAAPNDATAPVDDAAFGPGDAGTDAARPLPDGSVDAVSDSNPDATSTPPVDAGMDAPVDAPSDSFNGVDASDDAAETGPTVVCPGGRNVLIVNQSELGGLLGNVSAITLTNVDSEWTLGGSPFSATAWNGSFNVDLEFDSNDNLSPSTGTYPALASLAPDGGISVALSIGGQGCNATSGTVTVINDEEDDAGTSAFLATFDIFCGTSGMPDDELSGCVRYQAEPEPTDASVVSADVGYDAGIADTLDASTDGGDYLAPCLGHPLAFYIEGSALTASPEMMTETQGNWSASETSGTATLVVQTENPWQIEMAPPSDGVLTPGTTYDDAGSLPSLGPRFVLEANGVSCDSPSASFTIWSYADTGGDQASITDITASFVVMCSNGPGDVRGCVRFTE